MWIYNRWRFLFLEERYTIFVLLKKRMLVKDIADTINVLYSTVYRELKRNKGRHHYHYGVAQKQCDERKRRMRKHRKFSLEMRKEIIALMVNEQWSPEQIRGWMLRGGKACVCVETIYSYLHFDRSYGGELYKSCRHRLQHIKRNSPAAYTAIKERAMIDQRDPQADGTRFGDWEMDTIIGKDGRGAIVTLVERSKDYLLMRKLPQGKNAQALARTVVAMMTPFIGNIKNHHG
ncbi:IS30 family transposase [Bacteroides zoogleoformans]|uniref:IS30 family transposase n=1 Tax=Bacteroides zoogleoformans TaxID=28119 RepID=UPI0031ED45DF